MKDQSPSIQEWKSLYDGAREFKKIEPWKWMWDSDFFGVQNPTTGEMGYCCVMGRLGEHFALAVYLGTEGLRGYLKMQSQQNSEFLANELLHLHKCLMVSFEDRELLTKQDINLIKQLGLKFRGRNSWPLFRNYSPGYYPWYLTRDEVKYLTLVLEQAREVVLRFRDGPGLFISPQRGHFFARVSTLSDQGQLIWEDVWLKIPPLTEVEITVEPVDEVRLGKIKKMAFRTPEVWEIDFFYSPMVVAEGNERPYYPRIVLCADHYSGFILSFNLMENISGFPNHFLDFLEEVKSVPRKILVRKEEMFQILEPIASNLEIKLRKVNRLPMVEQAQNGIFEFVDR